MQGISVIIPLYNKAGTVARAIGSALRQQQVDVDVVVVDDGSTDGSDAVARSFGEQITYMRQENAGPGAARNRAVQAARYPVLALLDADDEFLPGCLAAHLDCRRQRPGTGVTLAPFRMVEADKTIEHRLVDRPLQLLQSGRFNYVEQFSPSLYSGFVGSALCFDRDVFEQVGGFDARLVCWEISDLLYRIVVRGATVGILDDILVLSHRDVGNSQFERRKADLKFRVIHAHNLLDWVDAVPPAQQARVLQPILHCMRELLLLGALDEFKGLARRLDPAWCETFASKTLHALRLVPNPLLRTASLLQDTRSRLARPPRRV